MDIKKIASLTGMEVKDGALPATWLDGRYRLNEKQCRPGEQNLCKYYVAVFSKGKLVEIVRDTDKESFLSPRLDAQEFPSGVKWFDYNPEYVYYVHPDRVVTKEKKEDAIKRWRQKIEATYQNEPFFDADCIKALQEMGIFPL